MDENKFCGVVDVQCEGWPKARRLVVWSFDGYDAARFVLKDAREYFMRVFGFAPGYAFVASLPKGAVDGQVVDGTILLKADWVPDRHVAVGGMA